MVDENDFRSVDTAWRMHEVSDGERRRVQIVSGLMAPWEVLLLDEVRTRQKPTRTLAERVADAATCSLYQVTVDLDVLVRSNLLEFLQQECKERGATVLYATHIFDGLDGFPSHVAHIQLGQTTQPEPIPWPIVSEDVPGVPSGVMEEMEKPNRAGSKMLALALRWLKEDKEKRIQLEQDGTLRARGAPKVARNADPTDSEAFYRKYDYSN